MTPSRYHVSVNRSRIEKKPPKITRHQLSDFDFVGSGSSEPPPGGPVSVRHDEFLAEAFSRRFRRVADSPDGVPHQEQSRSYQY